MRHSPLGRLVLALTTAAAALTAPACQVVAPRVEPPDARKADAGRADRGDVAKADGARASAPPAPGSPRPAASPAPTSPGVAPPPASAAPGGKLLRPAGDVTVLAGTVAVDASYLVARGGGNVFGHAGGQIVAAGSGLVGADAATLVAAGADNLIAAGGNVISPNGGQVVSPNGSRYALAQATPAPAVALGAMLPAAGMRLAVRDLRTGEPVALGVDASGQPVFAVYSSASGAFELYVPRALASNLRVEARVPGATDPRLAYEVLAAPGGAPAAIDEDSALVYGYLAESWRGRMRSLMTELAAEPPRSDDAVIRGLYGRGGTAAFEAMVGLLRPLIAELRAGMATHQVAGSEKIAAASRRAADTVLARMDLAGLVATQAPAYTAYLAGEEKAFAVFIEAVKQVRGAAAEQMRAAGPGGRAAFLAAAPYASAGDRIARPADVPAFIVAEAFTDEQDIQAGAAVAYLRPLGFDQAAALRLQGRIWAANSAAGEHLGVILATDAAVRADLIAALQEPAAPEGTP